VGGNRIGMRTSTAGARQEPGILSWSICDTRKELVRDEPKSRPPAVSTARVLRL